MRGVSRRAGRRLAVALASLAAVAGLAVVTGAQGGIPGPDADRPNVVIVQTDDQDVRSLAVMPKTRALIARQGTRFKQHLVTFPLCCPARATLFTGEYPHNHGVLGTNDHDGGGYAFLDHDHTLPVWLDDAGYVTAHIGKYMNSMPSDARPPGWDEWHSTFAGSTERMYGYRINHNGTIQQYGEDEADYQTDVFARLGVEMIEAYAGGPDPLYLQVDTFAPHAEPGLGGPRNPRPAPRDIGLYRKADLPRKASVNEADVSDKPRFLRLPRLSKQRLRRLGHRYGDRLASLKAVDDLVADLVAALDAAGELDETLFVFTSDNGYLLGEHRIPAGKRILYEEAVRVPLLIRGPGFPARTVRTLTGNIDLAPTILRLTGASESGRTLDGHPLQDLLADPGDWRPRLLLELGLSPSRAVRSDRWVLIDHGKHRRGELYDLKHDPRQLESLYRSRRPHFAAVRRTLRKRLRALVDCSGAACG